MVKAFLFKAFTDFKDQGNPAGIVLNEGLNDKEMLKIANMLQFSETTFIRKIDNFNYELRYFTPEVETNLCGHGTISAFKYINIKENIEGKVYMHTKSGKLNVIIDRDKIFMEGAKASIKDIDIDENILLEALRITKKERDYSLPIKSASIGTPKIMIPVKNREALFNIKPKFDELKKISQITNTKGFYPFTFDTVNKENLVHTRQFNPLFGVNEDPITGVAAGALGSYLKKYWKNDLEKFTVEQGWIVDKKGIIQILIKGESIYLGGNAVKFGETDIKI
ncbi:PhzF family phenazine biosynthesis protein [Clostridium lundense]|uniref:PhzF family phenazine biosynthesis protein n=1 Tax=Clostridium lundense TaxID=319475 RepID=UPI00047F4506|nr:PhzF family phenazine biosynthesis protein [Clostridium lundense]